MSDEFDDDDFDTLADDTFLHLEQTAIDTSTQKSLANRPGTTDRRPPTNSTIGTNARTAFQSRETPKNDRPPLSAPEPPSSDYGFDQEDVIDLDEPSLPVAPSSASALPNRSRVEPRCASRNPVDPETEAAFAAADAELGAPLSQAQWQCAPHLQPPTVDVAALQARLEALESETMRLRAAEQQARDAVLAKQGEIAIVRSNQEKSVREYEDHIAAMRKGHAEEVARARTEREAAQRERERMETEGRFLRHDLAQARDTEKGGVGKKGTLMGTGKTRISTPKKKDKVKLGGLGDGFEDGEVGTMASPNRKDATPRGGAKRKRSAVEGPATGPVLPLSGDIAFSRDDSHLSSEVADRRLEDSGFYFFQRILQHTPYESYDRTIEILATYHFPSLPEQSVSSLLWAGLNSSGGPPSSSHLTVVLAETILDLWARCLTEKYYPPLNLLLDLLYSSLAFSRAAVFVDLIAQSVPLCVRSVEVVLNTAVRAAINPTFAASDEYREHAKAGIDVDVDLVLEFLLRVCEAAQLAPNAVENVWRRIDLHFILLVLNKTLPISQIQCALKILSTSVAEASFGAVVSALPPSEAPVSREEQAKQERDIVDRLTFLLFDMPRAPPGEDPYEEEEVLDLRLAVLRVFQTLTETTHGLTLLADHRSFIGRLVRFLEAAVDALLAARPTAGMLPHKPGSVHDAPTTAADLDTSYELLAAATNRTLRVLHRVLTQAHTRADFDLTARLQVVKGGWHRFLVALTRIAFSEADALEEEAVEGAHGILDRVLSPEEGEAVLSALETPRGTGAGLRTGATMEEATSEGEQEDGMR